MDGSRFDRFTRALTTRGSRRQALGGLLGGAVALAFRSEHASAQRPERFPPKTGNACPPDTTPCTVVTNRPNVSSTLVNCCGAGQVCYKCTGGTLDEERKPGRGADFTTTSVTMCCTPGVSCPGDPEALFPTANGRRLDICSLN